jgi:replication-associated recombination protein RarA
MLLYGPPGTGKGTFVDILEQNPSHYLYRINAGMDGGINTVRDRVRPITDASGNTYFDQLTGQDRTFIVYNEAEKISAEAAVALREIIENTAAIFIFQANIIDTIDPAILSRVRQIEYRNPDHSKVRQFCQNILNQENATIPRKLFHQILTPVNGSIDMRSIIEKLEDFAQYAE